MFSMQHALEAFQRVFRVCAHGAADIVSVRRCQKLALCSKKPMVSGSKMEQPLAKAKSISLTHEPFIIFFSLSPSEEGK